MTQPEEKVPFDAVAWSREAKARVAARGARAWTREEVMEAARRLGAKVVEAPAPGRPEQRRLAG